jgi:hypothetical protein
MEHQATVLTDPEKSGYLRCRGDCRARYQAEDLGARGRLLGVVEYGQHKQAPIRGLPRLSAYFASWKMIPTVRRIPDLKRLTPCRRLTR